MFSMNTKTQDAREFSFTTGINQFLIQSRGQTYYFLGMDRPSDFKHAESSLGRVKIPFMEIFCAQYEQ